MKKPTVLFSNDEKKLIEDAIKKAESTTSGEIIPVVAAVSGRYDRAEDIFGLLFSIGVLAIYWFLCQVSIAPTESWTKAGYYALPFWPVVLVIVVGFIIGTSLATFFPVLRLPFISKKEMKEDVERRSLEMFQRLRVSSTVDSTGILIYISLYEHMVRVVGDDAINEKVEQKDWQEVCNLIIDGMKKKQPESALVSAIKRCGEMLTKEFPIKEGDVNELDNTLILLDE